MRAELLLPPVERQRLNGRANMLLAAAVAQGIVVHSRCPAYDGMTLPQSRGGSRGRNIIRRGRCPH